MNTKQVAYNSPEVSETERLRLSCRLCLAPEQDIPLYSLYQNSILYVEVLQQLADVEIKQDDSLPKKICMECASKLVLFYKFRKKIEISQVTLSATLSSDSDFMKLKNLDTDDGIEIIEQNEQIDDEFNEQVDQVTKEDEQGSKEDENEYLNEFFDLDDVIEESYTEIPSEQNSTEELGNQDNEVIQTYVILKKKGKKPTNHQCDECGRVFTRKTVLDQHKNTHTGIKNFSCDICKSLFTRRSHLSIHMRIHENSKPYICEMCSRGFRKSGDLARHRRIHFSDRNYPCPMCDKRFKRATDVTSHMRTHTKVKPYRCKQPKCEKTYTSHSSLRKHEMRKHAFSSISQNSQKTSIYNIVENKSSV